MNSIQKIKNERRVVVTGVTIQPTNLIVAYLFDRSFVNVGFEYGNKINITPEERTDYVFQLGSPDINLVRKLENISSTCVVLTTQQRSKEFDELNNIVWINDTHVIKSTYRLLINYGIDLGPISADKIFKIRANDMSFRIVLNMIVYGTNINESNLPFQLPILFKKMDELFEFSIKEIELIAKYACIGDMQTINTNTERTKMKIENTILDVVIADSTKTYMVDYLKREYLDYENLIPDGKPPDIVMIVHYHYQTNETCVQGYYNKHEITAVLKKIPEILFNLDIKKFSIRTKNFTKYFGNEQQTFKH